MAEREESKGERFQYIRLAGLPLARLPTMELDTKCDLLRIMSPEKCLRGKCGVLWCAWPFCIVYGIYNKDDVPEKSRCREKTGHVQGKRTWTYPSAHTYKGTISGVTAVP